MLAARAIPGIQIPAISPVAGSSLMAISVHHQSRGGAGTLGMFALDHRVENLYY